MRILFASIPSPGHFYPLVPLAWAMRSAGHEVLVATSDDFRPEVLASGLPMVACSGPLDSATILVNMLRTPWDPDQFRQGEQEGADSGIPDSGGLAGAAEPGFATLVTALLPGMLALVRDWRPDLVVIEPAARAAELSAAKYGIPLAVHTWGMLVPKEIIPAANAARQFIGPAERSLGLTAIPEPAAIIDTCPPTFQFPGSLSVQRMRYVPYSRATALPDWGWQPRGRRRACVTLGTLAPLAVDTQALLASMIAAAAGHGMEVVIAGTDEALAARAATAAGYEFLAAGWFPLDSALRSSDLLIHHGSSGCTMTALTCGVPQVAVPQFADHFINADRIEAVGIGRRVLPGSPPNALADAVGAVLGDPAIQEQAQALAAEAARQPSPATVTGVLEELVPAARPDQSVTTGAPGRK